MSRACGRHHIGGAAEAARGQVRPVSPGRDDRDQYPARVQDRLREKRIRPVCWAAHPDRGRAAGLDAQRHLRAQRPIHQGERGRGRSEMPGDGDARH
ncbi:hypothetical protein ACIRRA_33475 [Nocardia sp. NPDC101769]|uniref:hypothetical protein n=1 Tax=Nocardia sp. NPDC101769 TaxID=3364333 RepID=UPI0038054028